MPCKWICGNRYNLQQSASSMHPKDVLVKLKECSIAVTLNYIWHGGIEEIRKITKSRKRCKEEKVFISVNFMYISHRTNMSKLSCLLSCWASDASFKNMLCSFSNHYCILPPKNAKKDIWWDIFSTVDNIIFSDSVSYKLITWSMSTI